MPRDPGPLLEKMVWRDDDHLQIGDTNFLLTVDGRTLQTTKPTPAEFPLLKKKRTLQNLLKLLPESVDNMVELGIFDGGSIALYEELLSPSRFAGVEIDRERIEALDQYLEQRSATERVKLYYGTDQGDREALRRIVRDNFGSRPLDLVIDDASHRYEPCKASLNALLPLLRPGGVYLIEDWAWAHLPSQNFQNFGGEKDPMSRLIFESVMLSATRAQIISEVLVNNYQVALVRGNRDMTGEDFDISQAYLTRWRLSFSPPLSAKTLWKTWVPLPVRKQIFEVRNHLRQKSSAPQLPAHPT